MTKRLHFIGPGVGDFNGAEIEYLARYFASAGSVYPRDDKPPAVFMIPWTCGSELRRFWLAARDEVARRVPARAFALMDRALDTDDARQFEKLPTEIRRELYELCHATGCKFYVHPSGHVLPVGVTLEELLGEYGD